jgi:hypothetical protein
MRHRIRVRGRRFEVGVAIVMVFAAGVAGLALPSSSRAQLPGAFVSVCQVTGSVSAPNFAQVNVAVDQLAAYLNQFPSSFVGTCPSSGGSTGQPSGAVTVCRATGNASSPYAQVSVAADQVATYLNQNPGSFVGTCPASSGSGGSSGGTLPNGSVTVCSVRGSASAPTYAQANVAIDQLAAYLNRTPGFVGTCPSAGDPNGNPGPVPTGYATICRLTGNASSPYATLTVPATGLKAYLDRAGTILVAPSGGCPTALPAGSDNSVPPSSTSAGSTSTVPVDTTPNTVVTATGAGVHSSGKSDANGHAKITIKPKRRGIVTIRGAGGRVIKKIGVSARRQSGASLTG